jgi:hypothetical protein
MSLNVAMQQYRGTLTDLKTLASTGKVGVLAVTTDTNEVYIDSGTGTGIGAGNAWLPVSNALVGVNAQVANVYAIVSSDLNKLVTFTNVSATSVSMSQAGTSAFINGWSVYVQNLGAGAVTITPTTSTIGGNATLVLQQGQGTLIVSDGTNYQYTTGVIVAPAGQTFVTYLSGPTTNEWVTYIDSSGTQHLSQPGFSNLSGTLAQSQLPATIGSGSNLTDFDCGTF